jgi:hypothetical protein
MFQQRGFPSACYNLLLLLLLLLSQRNGIPYNYGRISDLAEDTKMILNSCKFKIEEGVSKVIY